jgi:hypothetical protein
MIVTIHFELSINRKLGVNGDGIKVQRNDTKTAFFSKIGIIVTLFRRCTSNF